MGSSLDVSMTLDCGSQYGFMDFWGLGSKHCDKLATELDPAPLHHDRGSPFGEAHLGDHHLEDGDKTMDLFPAGNLETGRGVSRLEYPNVTTDDSQVDLELRLGVLHPEGPVLQPEEGRNTTMPTLTEESWVETVRQFQSPHLVVPTLPTLKAKCITYSHGIYHHVSKRKWSVRVKDPTHQLGKKTNRVNLGFYNTEDDAKRAHDMATIKLDVRGRRRCEGDLNFPESEYADFMQEHSDWNVRDFIWKLKRGFRKLTKGRNSMKGVGTRHLKGRSRGSCVVSTTYTVRISWRDSNGQFCKHSRTGFTTEDQAGRFYDTALLALKGDDAITNFRPSSYSAAEIEEARKWLATWRP